MTVKIECPTCLHAYFIYLFFEVQLASNSVRVGTGS